VIELVDQQLKTWIGTVVDGADVRLGPPQAGLSDQVISLYLLDLAPAPVTAPGGRVAPQQLMLRYLVTAWDDDPEQAHRLLGEILFAATDHPTFDVDLDPVSATTWQAFGIAPRPAFLLRAPLRRDRPQPRVERIRHPMVLRASTVTSLDGLVLLPSGVPLAGARVELPALEQATHTDSRGRFRFAAVPAEPAVKRLLIRAKGRERLLDAEHHAGEDEPLVIHFDVTEEI